MEKKRNIEIDIVKGLGIILMVMGHCNFPYSKFIYLFHMSVFFIASGYLQKEEYSEDIDGIKIYVLRKLKTLWLPYFIFNTIFVLLNNIFIYMNIYTDNPLILTNAGENIMGLSESFTWGMTVTNIVKSFFFLGGTNMGVAFWFLRALFAASVIMCLLEYILKRIIYGNKHTVNKETDKNIIVLITEMLIAMILLTVGYFITSSGINARNIPVFLTSYFFMVSGRLFKVIEEKTAKSLTLKKSFSVALYIGAILISMAILIIFNNFTTVDLSRNKYTGIISMIIVSYAGWILMMFTAKLIKHLKFCKILVICGQNSLAVMILHILCFKLVSLIQVVIYNEPCYMLASFPVLKTTNGWWIAYTICGVSIPIILNEIRRMITGSKKIAFETKK